MQWGCDLGVRASRPGERKEAELVDAYRPEFVWSFRLVAAVDGEPQGRTAALYGLSRRPVTTLGRGCNKLATIGPMAMVVPAMHVGPWTERDLIALPEDGQRHELLEGILLVSPPPAARHQHVATQLELILISARPRALDVIQGVGVRLPGGSVFVPDVLVAEREAVMSDRSGILAPAVVFLVVEIVSPSSVTMDQVTKPRVYAQAGIPSFWRIELEGHNGPRIEAFRLRGRSYVSDGSAGAGEQLVVERPFPLSFDPARLL